MSFFVALSLLFALTSFTLYRKHANTVRIALPPGPPGSWKDGADLPIEPRDRFAVLSRWVRQYGPILTIKKKYGKSIVYLCDYNSAVQLLDKEGSLTSDRPRSIAPGEILCQGLCASLMRSGLNHSKFRKAFHIGLQPKVVQKYGPIQEIYVRAFITNILNDPSRFAEHAFMFAANAVIHITYGYSFLFSAPTEESSSSTERDLKSVIPSYTTPKGSSAEAIVERIHTTGSRFLLSLRPQTYLADAFPILASLPDWLYWPKYTLKKWHKDQSNLYEGMMNGVRNAMTKNIAGSQMVYDDILLSFCATLLDQQEASGLSDQDIAHICGGLFGAGSHATSYAISWIIMAAAIFPGARGIVQKELDSVVGHNRAPSSNDEKFLPLVTAFLLETYRWRPVTNEGVAHRLTKELSINEFVLPKGTIVYGHHWMIGRTPELFPDPDKFDPYRWIVKSASGEMKIREDIKTVEFGFGRRICPGMHLVNKQLILVTAVLLWAFDIDEDPSHPIDCMDMFGGLNIRPKPFKPLIKLRIPLANLETAFQQN